jgi:preprotein translocase subunit YajC
LNIILFLAQATQAASTTQGAAEAPGWAKLLGSPMFPLILGMVVLFMFMSKSKKKTEQKREDMLKQLKRGDRIQTIGGILGTVLRAEESRVEVKVDEGGNTKIWFTRSAIHRVVEEEKAEAK